MGSFLNCASYRLHKNKDMLGRSFCDNCGHTLFAKDLIPLFSYLFLFGKCRYCSEKILSEHFFAELFTGLLFLFFYIPIYSFFDAFVFTYFILIASLIAFVFIHDMKYYIIPDTVVYSLILLSFAYNIFISHMGGDGYIFIYSFIAALGAFLFFFSLFYLSRGRWLGFGDVKYAIFMGFFLSVPNIIVGLFISFFIGAIIGIMLLLLQKKELKSEIPFGPFLIIGTVTAHFFGEALVSLYLSYLF